MRSDADRYGQGAGVRCPGRRQFPRPVPRLRRRAATICCRGAPLLTRANLLTSLSAAENCPKPARRAGSRLTEGCLKKPAAWQLPSPHNGLSRFCAKKMIIPGGAHPHRQQKVSNAAVARQACPEYALVRVYNAAVHRRDWQDQAAPLRPHAGNI